MRLTCPSCGAQYEVPDAVIPETGRDVQCSNCGDTWFQTHRDHPAPKARGSADADDRGKAQPETDAPGGPPSEARQTDAPQSEKPQTEGPTPQEPQTQEPQPEGPPAPETPAPQPAAPPAAPEQPERRQIDPAVISVLREEAEREKRARAADPGGLETQPDLGLGEGRAQDRRARDARARADRLRGEVAEPQPNGTDAAARRSLFPDIEEINSSLAPAGAQGADAGEDPRAEASRRGGFRSGFLVAVLVAVLALLAYMFAPQLADAVPPLGDALADYVAWVDDLRHWLDGQIAALMLWLDGMASTASSGDIPAG